MTRESAVVDPDGAGPRIFFQRVPEGKPDEPRTGFVSGTGLQAAAPESSYERSKN